MVLKNRNPKTKGPIGPVLEILGHGKGLLDSPRDSKRGRLDPWFWDFYF